MKHAILAVLVVAGVVLASYRVSRSEVRVESQVAGDNLIQHQKGQVLRDQRNAWLTQETNLLTTVGMEPSGAGFHLLRPESDPIAQNYFNSSDPGSTVNFAFWLIEPAAPSPLMSWVSIERLFPNEFLRSAIAVPDGGSLFNVDVQFSPEAISHLTELIGETNPTTGYIDWYGQTRVAGQAPTEMTVVLVRDSKAHIPISITNLVGLPDSGAPIRVASGLDQISADKIVTALGF